MSEPIWLPLDEIVADPEIQPRATIDQALVEQYAEALKNEEEFPPVEAVDDGKKKWLWDGFYRLAAHRMAGKAMIQVNVQPGKKRNALLLAAGANHSHGQRRSNADKRRVILRFLMDPTWSKRSSRWIASQCKVSHTLVDEVRERHLADLPDTQPPDTRPQTREVQRGGTVYEQKLRPKQPVSPTDKLTPVRTADEQLRPERLTGMSLVAAKGNPDQDERKPAGHTAEKPEEEPSVNHGPVHLRDVGAWYIAELRKIEDKLTVKQLEEIRDWALTQIVARKLKR
jgi:hypothetical protein